MTGGMRFPRRRVPAILAAMARTKGMLGSAKVVMGFTLLSRITGLVRDSALAAVFGVGFVADAFNYGFMIPNLFRRLFGEGALSAVFVPVFMQSLDRDGRESAWELAGRVFSLLVVVLVGLAVVVEAVVLVVYMLRPGPLVYSLTAIMLPFMIGICLVALFSSLLNCLNHFAAPAFVPVILNLCMIAGIYLIGPAFGDALELRIYGVAVAVLAASAVQLLFLWPVLRRRGVRLKWSLTLGDPRLRRIMRLLLPMSVASGALLISAWLDGQVCLMMTAGQGDRATFHFLVREVAYPLQEGAWTAVCYARRLHQFPLGVLAISLATAAFPLFSRHAARGRTDELGDAVSGAVRIALFEGIPVGVLMIVLAEPIISLIFERYQFTHAATLRTARVLICFGLGMWAFCTHHIVLRGFYSLQDQLTPLKIGASLVVVNLALNLVLIWHPGLREAAFALSSSVTSSVAVVVGLWLLSRRMGRGLNLRRIGASLTRIALASTVAGVAAWGTDQAIVQYGADTAGVVVFRLARGLVPLAVGVIAYLLAAWVLRSPELHALLARDSGSDF